MASQYQEINSLTLGNQGIRNIQSQVALRSPSPLFQTKENGCASSKQIRQEMNRSAKGMLTIDGWVY